MSKYSIGQKVPREGKTFLIIFECIGDRKYAVRTMRQSIKTKNIPCPIEEIRPDKIVTLPNRKEIVLVKQSDMERWDTAHNDRIELTEEQIDEALADANAREVYASVATRRERGGNSSNLRYLPRRLEVNQED